LFYVDYVNIFGGNIPTVKENAKVSVAASKEIRLDINALKTNYIAMSRDQNAGRSHGMKTDNSLFGRV
jgi:hypothetical protein